MVMIGQRVDVVERPSLILPFEHAKDEVQPITASSDEVQDENAHWKKEDEEMESAYERFEHSKSDSLGWVQKNEVEIAKRRIRECLGFDPPPMAGWHMCVWVYEEKFARTADGKKTTLLLGSNAQENEKYRNCAGLVVAQGPECFLGKRFKENFFIRLLRNIKLFDKWLGPCMKKPWCRVGDWIMFPRHEGQMCNYRGLPMMMLPDIKMYTPIERPEFVTRDF